MLYESILNIVNRILEARSPARVMLAKVTSASPLQVLVDNRFYLGADEVIVPRDIYLAAGDVVALVRNDGGQDFLCAGVVGNSSPVSVQTGQVSAASPLTVSIDGGAHPATAPAGLSLTPGDNVYVLVCRGGTQHHITGRV
jgi:hypothetical protein